MNVNDLNIFWPETLLALFATMALLGGAFFPSARVRLVIDRVAIVFFLGLSVFFLLTAGNITKPVFGDLMIKDAFSDYAKFLISLSTAAVLIISRHYRSRQDLDKNEFTILVLLSVLGMFVMVSAQNLLMLYVGLELQSLALYVLAAFKRDDLHSSEAGIKYFILGAISSGLFLFGAALIYGFTGALSYDDLARVLTQMPTLGVVVGLALIFAATAFKLSAAPFHMWTPDVYQGAPTVVTAFFATAPKVAAIGMLTRFFYYPLGSIPEAGQQILIALALVSVFVGAIGAIGQRNIKRLLAYSSILNMGFLLLALASGGKSGLENMLVFLTIYVVMNLGAFAFVMAMARDDREILDIRELSGLSKKAPLAAMGFSVLLFSMAGIPPFAGFLGKFLVFLSAVEMNLTPVAVLAAIASVIGAFYYVRLVYYMYFGEENIQDYKMIWTSGQAIVFAISVVLMFAWMAKIFFVETPIVAATRALIGG